MDDPTLPAWPLANGSALGRRIWRLGWPMFGILLLLLVLGGLTYVSARILIALISGDAAIAGRAGVPALLLAALVYLLSHGLRSLRLALLIGGSRVGFRDIVSFHLMTAAATLAAPLKLGEVFRLIEMSNLVGGLMRAVMITWWERVFDAVVLLAVLLLVLFDPSASTSFEDVTLVIAVFVVGTLGAVFVLPDNLRRLSLLIIRRYRSPRTVPVLRTLDLIRRSILEAPGLVRGKVASLITLTLLIWTANIGCFALAIPAIRGDWAAASEELLGFLSSVLGPNAPLTAIYDPTAPALMRQAAAIDAPLAFIGLAAGIYFTLRRLKGLQRENAAPRRRNHRRRGVGPDDRPRGIRHAETGTAGRSPGS